MIPRKISSAPDYPRPTVDDINIVFYGIALIVYNAAQTYKKRKRRQ